MGSYIGIIVHSEADRPQIVTNQLFADRVVDALYEIYKKDFAEEKAQYEGADTYEDAYGEMMTYDEFQKDARATNYSATLQGSDYHIDYVVEYTEIE